MNKQHSIALLTCWYGDYPWYFPYFIKSCIHNPTIDFVIVTENTQEIPNKPSNVIIINKSLDEFKAEASKKLGFDLNFDNAYKLCDFKPVCGLLFQDFLEKYDFWGHGDIDMVYGNIRSFITTDILNKYDLISAHKDFITGTFCLYRNNDLMRTLFMESRDYQKVFSSPEWVGFDECNSLYDELQTPGVSVFDFPNHIQSMTYVVRKAESEGRIKPLFELYFYKTMHNKMRWDNGNIIYSNKKECLFYDMIKYKAECENKSVNFPIPDVFYFNKKGINKNSFWRLLGLKIIRKKKSLKKVQLFHS
ncbi:DUF6625 family protein [Flavobacterium sp. LM4]|uniref:DUF6625 family protein n=1 Tax=Flavobacterium sp. LM4 TaxID=1938609 RepID=UPI000991C672|nr:DUF6625 family protein [Flavobacterium sp. LM4]OOV20373.1 hypothetical protein BXU10_12455 [Flavobacterium sp. LM4]